VGARALQTGFSGSPAWFAGDRQPDNPCDPNDIRAQQLPVGQYMIDHRRGMTNRVDPVNERAPSPAVRFPLSKAFSGRARECGVAHSELATSGRSALRS
jgi:hypothetical protein